MLCQLYLAGLHYNEISCVTKMYNRQGEACFTLRYPKGSKGQSVVCPDKTKSTYDYAVQLLHPIIDGYTQGPSQLRNSIDNLRASVPNYLSTNTDEVNKAEAVAMFVSRNNR
ncbi:uncharacterized protein LOC144620240 [Crassostrea virginica]